MHFRIALVTLAALMFAPLMAWSQEPAKKKPNIVFIVIDDLRWDDIGCAGHPFVKTPHIDRIAKEGVRFRNFFATTPLCSPSRASILTGQYAHTHGVRDNRDNVALSMKLITFPLLLQRTGYHTGFVGKWHMGSSDAPRPGFHHWVGFMFDPRPGAKSAHYIDPELNVNGRRSVFKGYVTDILTDQAIGFIKDAKKTGSPFALYLAHKAVHPDVSFPFEKASSFVPAERHKHLYADQVIPRAPSAKKSPEGIPALARKIGDLPPLGPDTGTTDDTIRNRLRMLAAVDEGIGKMLKTLEEAGQLDNTVIVFTSDNGYFYGEHGLSDERRLAYEESIRLPLLMRYPPRIPAGTTDDRLTLTIDLAPTMLDMAGVAIPPAIEGRSLLPLPGKTENWRRSFLIEYFSDTLRARIPNMGYQAVRTSDWVYIRYTELKDMDELYDLRTDPYQMRNLIQSAGAQEKLGELRAEMQKLMKSTSGRN
jgi:N-acetylglucosamine-6-sulfatase